MQNVVRKSRSARSLHFLFTEPDTQDEAGFDTKRYGDPKVLDVGLFVLQMCAEVIQSCIPRIRHDVVCKGTKMVHQLVLANTPTDLILINRSIIECDKWVQLH